jgi:plasmid maintenance system antidote protein VapI
VIFLSRPIGLAKLSTGKGPFLPTLLVNGKRAISADTALRLQRYFGIEAQFWLNLQTEYDLRMIKRKVWSDIEQRIIPVKTTEIEFEHTTGA